MSLYARFWGLINFSKFLPKIAPYYPAKIIVFAANALRAISYNNSSFENIRKTGHFRHFQGQDQKLPVRIEILQNLQNPKIPYPEPCQSILRTYLGFWGSSTHHRNAAHQTNEQNNVFLLKIWACWHFSAWCRADYIAQTLVISPKPPTFRNQALWAYMRGFESKIIFQTFHQKLHPTTQEKSSFLLQMLSGPFPIITRH